MESRYRMYRGQFSIQKCILAIELAENLGKKKLNLSSTIYSNLYPHLSPKKGGGGEKINHKTPLSPCFGYELYSRLQHYNFF